MAIKAISEGMTLQQVQLMMANCINSPNSLSLSFATAYQATTPSKSALLVVNLTSTATLNIGGGQTHSAEIVIGSTAAVASGTGSVVCRYRNSQTGTVVVGVGLSAQLDTPCAFYLPENWYFAVRQTSGTITITSAFDQSIG